MFQLYFAYNNYKRKPINNLSRYALPPVFVFTSLIGPTKGGFIKDSTTTAKLGEFRTNITVLNWTDNRLVRTTYQGFEVSIKEISKARISAAHLTSVKLCNQFVDCSFPPMMEAIPYFRVEGGSFSYAGSDFNVGKNAIVSAWHGELSALSKQNDLGVASSFDEGRVGYRPTEGYKLSS